MRILQFFEVCIWGVNLFFSFLTGIFTLTKPLCPSLSSLWLCGTFLKWSGTYKLYSFSFFHFSYQSCFDFYSNFCVFGKLWSIYRMTFVVKTVCCTCLIGSSQDRYDSVYCSWPEDVKMQCTYFQWNYFFANFALKLPYFIFPK